MKILLTTIDSISVDWIKLVLLPICVSFLFFVIINFIISPRIKVSNQIRKFKDGNKYHFEFRIVNRSCFLKLTNISVEYKIVTPYQTNNDILSFFSNIELPYIKNKPFFNCKKRKEKNSLQIEIFIETEGIKDYLQRKKEIYVHASLKNKIISIDDFFLNEENTSFQIVLFGYSSFTGVKKTYKSKELIKSDIKEGIWKKLSVIKLESDGATTA